MTKPIEMRNKTVALSDDLFGNQLLSLVSDIQNYSFDEIFISIENNHGGEIVDVLDLIRAIQYSDTRITLSAKELIASAAAVLYFFLLINSHKPEFKNVKIAPLDDKLTVTFHRLRNAWEPEGNVFHEPMVREDYNISMDMNFEQTSAFIDNLFDELTLALRHFGKKNLAFKHMIEEGIVEYYSNNDFTFIYDSEMQNIISEFNITKGAKV